jgi:hypothetical protein
VTYPSLSEVDVVSEKQIHTWYIKLPHPETDDQEKILAAVKRRYKSIYLKPFGGRNGANVPEDFA